MTPLGYSLGEAELERYFFYDHMVDWSLEKIALEAEEELAVVTHELTELALSEFASKSWSAVIAPKPLAEPLESEVVAAESRVLAFLRERDGSSPLDASIPVRRVPAYFPGAENGAALASQSSRARPGIVFDGARRGAAGCDRARASDVAGDRRPRASVCANRRARRVYSDVCSRRRRRARVGSRNSSGVRFDEGFHAGSHELCVEHYQRAMLDLVRLLTVIGVHAHGQSLEDAAALFRERAFVSPSAARAEAERIAVDPSRGDSALGRLLVKELAAELPP